MSGVEIRKGFVLGTIQHVETAKLEAANEWMKDAQERLIANAKRIAELERQLSECAKRHRGEK